MTTRRKPTRRKQLGLNVADYDAMLAAQGGGCAICGNPPKTRRLDVDHDHKTGMVRGLLCHRCNRVLPTWVTAQWMERARRYLLGQSVKAAVECVACAITWDYAFGPGRCPNCGRPTTCAAVA